MQWSMGEEYLAYTRRRYDELRVVRPDAFHNPDPNGIVILTNEEEIYAAEQEIAERMIEQNRPADWSRAGLFYEDPWIYVTRDVVRFPSKDLGTYHHIIMKGGSDGVVILPVINGKVVLIRHFRNGLRNWTIEVPRGAPAKDLSSSDNARQEIIEEIQGKISHLEYLGPMHNNNGLVSETMQVYFAELSEIGNPNLSEGIDAIIQRTPAEFEKMIAQGEITDCHTIVAYSLARLRDFLPSSK